MAGNSNPSRLSTANIRARAAAHAKVGGRPNSLGLSAVELETVHEQLDAKATDPNATHKRQSARLAFRETSVGVEIMQPGGGQSHIDVACRNLSRTGMGFLHSSYVHLGTRVVVTLARKTSTPVRVHARVVRCRHVVRHVHEVGVKFDAPINVRDFMALDPLTQVFTRERVDPGQLKGTVLVIAEYRVEQACIQSMLQDTAVELSYACSLEEGVEEARHGVGLIICDDAFEVGSGPEFVKAARKAGVRTPIVLMSADTSELGQARIRQAEADAFLAKPIDRDVLLRAVAEFLLTDGDRSEASGPLYSTLAPDSPMRGLVDRFVEDLNAIADKFDEHAKNNDGPAIRKACLKIGGPAAQLGFEHISKLCSALVHAIDTTGRVEQCLVQINTLSGCCRAVRKGEAESAPAAGTPDGASDAGHHGKAAA